MQEERDLQYHAIYQQKKPQKKIYLARLYDM